MRLEVEKRKIEDALEAERNLTLDKDALLERSKKRELELEEEVAALQGDLDTLDSQLDRALNMQKESEDKHEALRKAFDEAAEHLVRLEGEQRQWATREEELLKRLASTDRDQGELHRERDGLQKEATELRRQLAQRDEDLSRIRERMDAAISELDVKLGSEVQAWYVVPYPLRSRDRSLISYSVTLRRTVQIRSSITSDRRGPSWLSSLAPHLSIPI
jgi:myosin heavy chain 9/10/11/14